MAVARIADRTTLLVVVFALLLAYPPRSHALEPAYLKEWPSAEQVLADHQGQDRQDTPARQMAALHHMDRSIEDRAGTRRWQGLTPDEKRLRGEYYAAAECIRDEVNSTLSNKLPPGFNGPFAKPPLRKWYALQWKYERDPQVRAQTLSRYLSPPLLAELGAKKTASEVHDDVQKGRMFATVVLISFAATKDFGGGDTAPEATQADAAALPLPINPPATRLHPAGPNAEMGQRLLMAVFTARLAKAVARST